MTIAGRLLLLCIGAFAVRFLLALDVEHVAVAAAASAAAFTVLWLRHELRFRRVMRAAQTTPTYAEPSPCGAESQLWPGSAFRMRCWQNAGHDGPHSGNIVDSEWN